MKWTQGIPSRVLLYPCAGSDLVPLLDGFNDPLDEFTLPGGTRQVTRSFKAPFALASRDDDCRVGVPEDLVADGLVDADYDRVSVAYGLSRLDVGRVIRAMPIPKISIAPVKSWTENYIDKDQC